MKIGHPLPMSRFTEDFSAAQFVEMPARNIATMEPEDYQVLKAMVDDGSLKTYSVNCLTPNELRLTGPEMDMGAIREYIKSLFAKLAELKVSMIVFGAGRSKAVPEGFAMRDAWEQLYELGEFFADEARQYGQIIAVEPLSYHETNILNTVGETVEYTKVVNRDNFKTLVDFYHYHNNGEKLSALPYYADEIVHAHIAAPIVRTAPQNQEHWDFFQDCIRTLNSMGYQGGLCYEGKFPDDAGLAEMMETMKAMDGQV